MLTENVFNWESTLCCDLGHVLGFTSNECMFHATSSRHALALRALAYCVRFVILVRLNEYTYPFMFMYLLHSSDPDLIISRLILTE